MTQNLRLCPVRDNISVEIVYLSTTERAVRYAIFRTLYSVPTGRLFQYLRLFTINLTVGTRPALSLQPQPWDVKNEEFYFSKMRSKNNIAKNPYFHDIIYRLIESFRT